MHLEIQIEAQGDEGDILKGRNRTSYETVREGGRERREREKGKRERE